MFRVYYFFNMFEGNKQLAFNISVCLMYDKHYNKELNFKVKLLLHIAFHNSKR
jgi:hypothetical protein